MIRATVKYAGPGIGTDIERLRRRAHMGRGLNALDADTVSVRHAQADVQGVREVISATAEDLTRAAGVPVAADWDSLEVESPGEEKT